MNYWLFKSEPSVFSFEALKAKGKAGTQWDGVRNYAARNNMKAMQIGDLGFFYHSNEGLNVVGIAEVCALAHPDTTTDDPRWECVDIRAFKDVPKPVAVRYGWGDDPVVNMFNGAGLPMSPFRTDDWKMITAEKK